MACNFLLKGDGFCQVICKGISLNRIFCGRAPDYACANHSLSIGGRPAIDRVSRPVVSALLNISLTVLLHRTGDRKKHTSPFLLFFSLLTYKHIHPSTHTRPSGIYPSSSFRHSQRTRHHNKETPNSHSHLLNNSTTYYSNKHKDIHLGPKLWSDSLLLVRPYLQDYRNKAPCWFIGRKWHACIHLQQFACC